MPSLNQPQNSTTEQYSNADALQHSGSDVQQALVEQLSFSEPAASDNSLTPLLLATKDPGTAPIPQTQALSPMPLVTRELAEVKTDAFSTTSLQNNTTTLRPPIFIRGTGRKSVSLRPPASRHHPIKHAVATVVLALVVLSVLFAVIPLGNNGQSSLFKSIVGGSNDQMNITSMKSDNLAAIAPQAATATAVTTDGFDQGAAVYAGVPTAPPSMSQVPGATGGTGSTGTGSTGSTGSTGTGSTGSTGTVPIAGGSGFNRFFYGQCTYWANMRYYELTGHQVPFIGNAYEWTAGAYNYGWNVSTLPRVPSIIVLPPGVQNAGAYGHVAVVESINANGSVVTSDWNWAGNWGVTTYVTFTPDAAAGVRFLSY